MVFAWFILLVLKSVKHLSPESYKVGAIYIEGSKWSVGYNKSKHYGSHAEEVALNNYKKKYNSIPSNGVMYCTLSPCSNCTKVLAKHDIISVYHKKYTGKL